MQKLVMVSQDGDLVDYAVSGPVLITRSGRVQWHTNLIPLRKRTDAANHDPTHRTQHRDCQSSGYSKFK